MTYLINNNNDVEIFFTKEEVINSGFNPNEAFMVTDEDFKNCGGKAYVDLAGNIQLGDDPLVVKRLRIRDLKQFLRDTDYIDNKIVEGDATIEDYHDVIEKRRAARKEIDKLEQ